MLESGSMSTDNDKQESHIPALAFEGVCLLVSLCLVVSSLYFFGLCCKKRRNEDEIDPLIKFPVILALFFNLVGVICMYLCL